MKALCVAVLGASLAACAETPPELQAATIADLDYSIPVGWESREVAIEPGARRVEWRPSENHRDETIAIVVTPRLPFLAGHGIDAAVTHVGPMLQTLPGARFGEPTPFTSRAGLKGLAVRGTFAPTGTPERRTRSHAILEHGDGLAHVIYTARSEDPSREAYQAVLDSLHGASPGGAP